MNIQFLSVQINFVNTKQPEVTNRKGKDGKKKKKPFNNIYWKLFKLSEIIYFITAHNKLSNNSHLGVFTTKLDK